MTNRLLAHWREDVGALSLKMPTDPPPTLTDFRYALANHMRAEHEDSGDVLNEDGTWGPPNVGAEGGSGIAFGYACSDSGAVLVAADAVHRRPVFYDWEHWVRQIRYAIAAYDMTHDAKWKRRIIAYDNMARGTLSDDPTTIHLNDPSWIPFSLAQYGAMAQAGPHKGLPWNARAVGWIAYGHAMRLKVDPSAGGRWAQLLLDTCRLAAVQHTGQLVADSDYGKYTRPVQATFQWGILVHAVLALCYQCDQDVPQWIFNGMDAIQALPRLDYYGTMSPVKYAYTENGKLVAYDGPGQSGDPGFAYWSSNCVALAKLTGDRDYWLRRAAKIGPTTNNSEDERKISMLYRGAIQ